MLVRSMQLLNAESPMLEQTLSFSNSTLMIFGGDGEV